MTVQELFEKDLFCDFLEVTVRENGCGKWLYQYRIGENVQNAVHDDMFVDGEWKHMGRCVVPHNRTERKLPNGLMGVLIPKRPDKAGAMKDVADLEVCNFRISHLFCEVEHRGRGDWHGLDIMAYPKGWTKPEQPRPIKNDETELEQISLFDKESEEEE